MDPLSIMGIAGAGANLLIQGIQAAIAAGDRAKAAKLYEQLYEQANGIKPPPQQTMEAITQAESSLTGYQEDPRLKSAQMKALEGLEAEVSARGMTPEDQAAYNQARLESESMAAAQRGAAEQRQAARGMTSGTGSLAAELGAGQAATNRLAQQGVDIAAASRKRYLDALESLGGFGSKVRGQEFDIASQRASAQDAINRFNAMQGTEAQKYNLEAAQRDFDNQLRKLGAMRGVTGAMAGQYSDKAEREEEAGKRWGKAAEEGFGTVGAAFWPKPKK